MVGHMAAVFIPTYYSLFACGDYLPRTEADVFEYLRREFPYVHVSAETKRRLLHMYRRQMKYITSLVEPVQSRKITIRVRRDEMEERRRCKG